MTIDVERVRKDFPILSRTVHGRPLVYLDNAATSQKPRAVIDALVHYYETYNAAIHRGIHTLAEEATARYEEVRDKTARFIGAADARSIVFTRNTTEAINLVAYAWGLRNLKPGDEIVLTVMEHHSNIVPWQIVAKLTGARLQYVDIDDKGRLLTPDLERLIGPKTRIVACALMSNVLGTVNPVADVARLAHARGALFVVDGAQGVPQMPVDVAALDCDFLAFSAHKMLGPTGVGVLYGRLALLESMEPFLGGGSMIGRVQLDESTWNEVPWRFEAGVPNIADVIAFGAALEYLQGIGMENVRAHELELAGYAIESLSRLPEVTLYGPREMRDRGGVVAFNVGDLHPHDVGTVLDHHGVAVRAGHHCAQPLMRRLSVVATARASFQVYNRKEDVDVLVEAVKEATSFFGHVTARAGA